MLDVCDMQRKHAPSDSPLFSKQLEACKTTEGERDIVGYSDMFIGSPVRRIYRRKVEKKLVEYVGEGM